MDDTATRVEELVSATNLTPSAALAQVKAEAAKPAKPAKVTKAKRPAAAPKQPKAKKATKPAKTANAKSESAAPREGTAKAKVIAMMQRKGGATLDSNRARGHRPTSRAVQILDGLPDPNRGDLAVLELRYRLELLGQGANGRQAVPDLDQAVRGAVHRERSELLRILE